MDLVTSHWSGKHRRVVMGINLISLLWTDSRARLPCDFRIYNKKEDGLTKNDHFIEMLDEAKAWGFSPQLLAFDSWYASLNNLKRVRTHSWHWLTQLKGNRLVDPDGSGNRAISKCYIPSQGRKAHLKRYGWVKVFKTVSKDGTFEYWATSDLEWPSNSALFTHWMLGRSRCTIKAWNKTLALSAANYDRAFHKATTLLWLSEPFYD